MKIGLLLSLLLFMPLIEASPIFQQATIEGCHFRYHSGATGKLYFHEMMGSGVALFDYDNDGDLDLYFVQGGNVTTSRGDLHDQLCRNEGLDPTKQKVFWKDVSRDAGLAITHDYGMGIAVADVNQDGWLDVYLTNFGPNRLLINKNGRFVDETERWQAGEGRWSVSASFVDYDSDGDMDLFVANYVDYSLTRHKTCRNVNGEPDYCSPKSYNPVPDRLLRNDGDHFTDVTGQAGIAKHYGNGLGVIAGDFNGDGWPDIYVANDGVPNQMWLNRGNGKFIDDGMLSGTAVNGAGMAEASMGVVAEDFDNDGDLDLFMTHLTRETNTLYVNDGQGWFSDKTAVLQLAGQSLPYTGFGTVWKDFNGDNLPDIFVANGAVTLIPEQVRAGIVPPLKQRNQLFIATKGVYVEQKTYATSLRSELAVGRGVAAGDIDNDGDIDLVINNNDGAPTLLINRTNPKHWLGLAPRREPGKPVVAGVQAVIQWKNKRIVRRTYRDGSYASSHDPRIVVALPDGRKPEKIELVWPNGTRQVLTEIQTNQYQDIFKPKGKAK